MENRFWDRVYFSCDEQHEKSIKIAKYRDVNYFETLCKYVADHDIEITAYEAVEFEAVSKMMKLYGSHDRSCDHYYFWII